MTDMMSNSSKVDQSVPKVALILTDGKSTSGIELLHQSAMYADRNNVYVMAIGVGEEVNLSPTELDNMTHGINEHQQIIPYRDLTKSVDRIVEQICYRKFFKIYLEKLNSGVWSEAVNMTLLKLHIEFKENLFLFQFHRTGL